MRHGWVVGAALLLDLLAGEPPNCLHPVVWMGTFIGLLRRRAPQGSVVVSLVYGGGITVGGVGLVWLMTRLWGNRTRRLPSLFHWAAHVWLLKTTLSLRGLDRAAASVETALRSGDLAEARRLLSWHLVSRDTTTLSAGPVSAAAVESVAENTSDGIIAPLFWYVLGGLPAALAYRYVNTCDSLLGYRDAEREWLGKISARTDDLLNLIPARLTALLLLVLRPTGWRVWRQDARLTASPNAGHPMSAMAGALGVELEKVGYYRLNAGARLPAADDIQRARRLMFGAVGLALVLLIFLDRRNNAEIEG